MDNDKMSKEKNDRCIAKQIQFLILETMHNDPDYQKSGIRLDNVLAVLAENKSLWLKRGEGKKWNETLDWALSNMYDKDKDPQKHWLDKKQSKRVFCWSDSNSENGLKTLVGQLTEDLELDIDFGLADLEQTLFLEDKIQMVRDGSAPWEFLSQSLDGKGNLLNRSILTVEQGTRLAELSLHYGFYE